MEGGSLVAWMGGRELEREREREGDLEKDVCMYEGPGLVSTLLLREVGDRSRERDREGSRCQGKLCGA
jgi:hypothetical protein